MRRLLVASAVGAALLGAWACREQKSQAQPPPGTHADAPGAPHEHGDEAAPHGHGPAAPGAEEPGTVNLSPEAQANIGLTTAAAAVQPIERTLLLNATLQVDPDRDALVSSRVTGKVLAVNVGIGDRVRRGEPLVVLQSLQIAETPPKVEVTSPLDGVVLDRSVTVGAAIDPTTPLLRVADLSHVLAQAEVYEADVGLVRRGQAARLRVTAYPGRVFTGRVVRLADAIDPEHRTLRVWVQVPNTPDRLLKPAMFGQIVLVLARSAAAVTVPNEAVQSDGPERFVFVRNGQAFVKQPVVVGDSDDRFTAITRGIVAGDEVVTRGAAELAALASQPAGGGVQDESKPHID